jgi:peptide/nickel transport system substrate-binding protein
MRQAVQMVVDQADYMAAYAGDQKNWNLCASFFTCGTPMASTAGAAALTGKRDYEKARQLINEAQYKGEKIVLLDAVDSPLIHSEALVLTDELKKLGLNVEYVATDLGTVFTRLASKKPPAEGGWNIFAAGLSGVDTLDPAGHTYLGASGAGARFGWPKDDRLEALRAQWLRATALEERQEIAGQLQRRAFEVVPYIPTGEFIVKTAYRKNIKGILESPGLSLKWNVEKV